MQQLDVAGRHGYAFGRTKPIFLWLIKFLFLKKLNLDMN
jgi:hypothetical protein